MTLLRARSQHGGTSNGLGLGHKPAAGFAASDAQPKYAPDLQLEPIHLEIDLRVDLEKPRLDVVLRHTVRCNTVGAHVLALHGVELLDMEVRTSGVDWDYDGQQLQLVWQRRFVRNETRVVELRYAVEEPRSGLFFTKPSPAHPDACLLAITDHETERARHWLCTVDLPSVRPTLSFRITAQQGLTVLANGALKSETKNDDGTQTVHWACASNVPSYLTCFAVGDFVRWDGGEVDGVPIAAFAPAALHDEANLERSFRRTADMLEWLPEKLGVPFPYEKYFQIGVPWIGGAMENISLTTWDDRFLLDDALESEERQLLDVINLHEMAHTWFGDLIICRDYAHAWLKESWATYMETCWLEHDLGQDAKQHDLWMSAQNYFKECETRYVRPIVTRAFDSSWDMYDHHLYPGGAWRLQMLRQQLGDEVFWSAVRQYVDHYAGELVETDDFRRTLEVVSGRSLAQFFDEWIHAPGFPILEGRFRFDAATHTGTFELAQKQKNTKRGVGLFHLEVDIAWWVDGERREQRVAFDGASLRFVVDMPAAPDRVRIDPHLGLLHQLRLDLPDGMWRAQLEQDDAWGRMQAARVLVATGRRQNVAAVQAAFEREKFWGVRSEIAAALGDAANEASFEALLTLCAKHKDPQSLASVFHAASKYRDPRLVPELVQRLRTGMPPRATEAALDALGAQREDAPADVLIEHAQRRERSEFGAVGAVRAMAASRHRTLHNWLVENAPPGTLPDRVRAAVCAALGTALRGAAEEERAPLIEALEARLRDSIFRVRVAAAQALCTGRSRGSYDKLRAYQVGLPDQERIRFQRQLDTLRRSDRPDRSDDRLEKAERTIRALEGRLEKLEAAKQPDPKA